MFSGPIQPAQSRNLHRVSGPRISQHPFLLSTGRTLYNYNVGNMTRKSAAISQKQDRNFVEMHESDAQRLGVRDGGPARVTTRRGTLVVRAHVGDKVRPGCLWMPFHFVEASTNQLTNDAFDTVTRTGEYKCCAARVEFAEALDAESQEAR